MQQRQNRLSIPGDGRRSFDFRGEMETTYRNLETLRKTVESIQSMCAEFEMLQEMAHKNLAEARALRRDIDTTAARMGI
jgi:hypothetical protein